MGYVRHNAIIVTGGKKEHVELARAKAVDIFAADAGQLWSVVSEVIASPINGYDSFFIAPDGSKEGWSDSDSGDKKRTAFKKWLIHSRGEHIWLDWFEARYGGNHMEVEIIDHSKLTEDE